MLKVSRAKVNAFCTIRPWTLRKRHDTEKLAEADEIADIGELCQTAMGSVKSSTPERLMSESVDSLISQTTKAVQEIIAKEVSAMAEPLLHDVADHECAVLDSDTSLKIENVSCIIAESFVEAVRIKVSTSRSSLQQLCQSPDFKKTSGSPLPREGGFLKEVGDKVKAFFATRFTKLSINRIRTQLKNKFFPNSKVQNSESLKSFIDSIDTLFETENDDELGGNEHAVFSKLRRISEGQDSGFTQKLGDVLHSHLSEEVSSQADSKQPSRETLYAAIAGKVWRLLGMMRWWVKTKASEHSLKVVLDLMDSEVLSPSPTVLVSVNKSQTPSVTQSENASPTPRVAVSKSTSPAPKVRASESTSPILTVTLPVTQASGHSYKVALDLMDSEVLSPSPTVLVSEKKSRTPSVTNASPTPRGAVSKSASPEPDVRASESSDNTCPSAEWRVLRNSPLPPPLKVILPKNSLSPVPKVIVHRTVLSPITEEDVQQLISTVSQVSRSSTHAATREQTVKYTQLSVLVTKVVSRIYSKAKITHPAESPETFIRRVIEKTWAELEGQDFTITPKTYKRLDKTIVENMCRKWGCVEDVLVAMALEGEVVENYIACSVKYLLLTPPKNKMSKFFGSFGKAVKSITGIFKRS
ncbi:uncharacterized protein LOC131989753 [Centropristis striata]|uniref:uncharacterized protein LOC131989753 n=1 Tax=Centropristis striata TaxID=184440 RepID=UPI0027E0F5F9|nr:uncharacterized protein LOC131989753 [Centropristis striata]